MIRHLDDEADTAAFGAALASVLAARPGAVVYLYGDLGAGKTTLARGLLRGCGVGGAIRSPTYTLLEPYSVAGRELLHMDLYRLRDPEELHQLGLVDYPPERTVWLVEWPQRGAGVLPPADISIAMRTDGKGRNVELTGLTEHETAALVAKLA